MESIDIGGGIASGAKGLEKKKERLKKSQNERKSNYSAKYQAPTTIEHIVLVIHLATTYQPPVVPLSLVGNVEKGRLSKST